MDCSRPLRAVAHDVRLEHLRDLAICEQQLGNYCEASLWAHRYQSHGGNSTKLMTGLPGYHARSAEGTEWLSKLPKWIYFQILLFGIWSLLISILTAWNIFGNKRKPLLVTFFVFTGFVTLTPHTLQTCNKQQLGL